MISKKIYISILTITCLHTAHGMDVSTKDGKKITLPQSFIDASPKLKKIQGNPSLQNLNLRGLFSDQLSVVVYGIIQDYTESVTREPVKIGNINHNQDIESICLYIALARRLEMDKLARMYLVYAHGSRN